MKRTFKFVATEKVIPIHCIHVKNKRFVCGNEFYLDEDELDLVKEHIAKGYVEELGEIEKATLLVNIDCDGDECGNCEHKGLLEEVGIVRVCNLFGEHRYLKRCESCLKAGEAGKEAVGALVLQNIRAGNFTIVKKEQTNGEEND